MKNLLLAGSAVLALSASAHAATIKYMGGESGYLIYISGILEYGDAAKFTSIVKKNHIKKALVTFDSPGGDVYAGLTIGTIIKEQKFYTEVFKDCESACAAAWIAGNKRYMASDARIGFHSTAETKNGVKVESKVGNRALVAYYQSLGIGIMSAVAMIAAPPNNMSWYTPRDFADIGKPVEVYKSAIEPAGNACTSLFDPTPVGQCQPKLGPGA